MRSRIRNTAIMLCFALVLSVASCSNTRVDEKKQIYIGVTCYDQKDTFIGELMEYPLLILDDFGMERKTEFANEQIFNVIDERYRSRKPLIVTTNLPLDSLRNPDSLEMSRIYDRLLAMCTPVGFGDKGRRQAKAAAKMQKAAEFLRG